MNESKNQETLELLPCPCGAPCDGDPYPINREGSLFRLDCACPECGWSCIAPTAEQALIDWNRRAPDRLAALAPAGVRDKFGESASLFDIQLVDTKITRRPANQFYANVVALSHFDARPDSVSEAAVIELLAQTPDVIRQAALMAECEYSDYEDAATYRALADRIDAALEAARAPGGG